MAFKNNMALQFKDSDGGVIGEITVNKNSVAEYMQVLYNGMNKLEGAAKNGAEDSAIAIMERMKEIVKDTMDTAFFEGAMEQMLGDVRPFTLDDETGEPAFKELLMQIIEQFEPFVEEMNRRSEEKRKKYLADVALDKNYGVAPELKEE